MTNAIQKLIEWQAGDPKRRGWSIHQYGEIVRIQMRSEPFRCDQEVTTRTVQQAKFDVLEMEVEQAIAKLAVTEMLQPTENSIQIPVAMKPLGAKVRHGETCRKESHWSTNGKLVPGLLHKTDDDSPYDVDGVLYCGRCHEAL